MEYDYWGIKTTTHDEDECTNAMMDEVLTGDPYFDDTPVRDRIEGGCPQQHQWLSEQDRETLIKYAPKLFDALPVKYDLVDTMAGLAKILGKHRFEVMWQKNEKARMDSYSHSKKSQEDRVDALKAHIEAIVRIIGTDIYVPKDHEFAQFRTPHDDLLDELERAYQDPMGYLPAVRHTIDSKLSYEYNESGEMVSVPHYTQAPLKKYLTTLSLPGKSDIIEEFVKEISDQNWFQTFLVKQQRPPIF